MGLFSKTKAKVDKDGNRFSDAPVFDMAWENTRQPSPGAQSYAWETLGLVQYSPIGPSVNVRNPRRVTEQQVYAELAVRTDGVPTVAGQIILQPLFDPQQGYVQNAPEMLDPRTFLNVPASEPMPLGANETDPGNIGL